MAEIRTNILLKARDAAHKKARNHVNHPWKSLENPKCPTINDLPSNEILTSIFSIGVKKEEDGDDEWEDMNTREGFDANETG